MDLELLLGKSVTGKRIVANFPLIPSGPQLAHLSGEGPGKGGLKSFQISCQWLDRNKFFLFFFFFVARKGGIVGSSKIPIWVQPFGTTLKKYRMYSILKATPPQSLVPSSTPLPPPGFISLWHEPSRVRELFGHLAYGDYGLLLECPIYGMLVSSRNFHFNIYFLSEIERIISKQII